MNEFEGWQKILTEWRDVQRVKRLNQELYDMLGGSLMYLIEYAEHNSITLPNKDRLWQMVEKSHTLMTSIDSPTTPNN
jgi:hypothetical protein